MSSGVTWTALVTALSLLQFRPLAVPRAEQGESYCIGFDVAWICAGRRALEKTCLLPAAAQPIAVYCESVQPRREEKNITTVEEVQLQLLNFDSSWLWTYLGVFIALLETNLFFIYACCCHGKPRAEQRLTHSGSVLARPDIVARTHYRTSP